MIFVCLSRWGVTAAVGRDIGILTGPPSHSGPVNGSIEMDAIDPRLYRHEYEWLLLAALWTHLLLFARARDKGWV